MYIYCDYMYSQVLQRVTSVKKNKVKFAHPPLLGTKILNPPTSASETLVRDADRHKTGHLQTSSENSYSSAGFEQIKPYSAEYIQATSTKMYVHNPLYSESLSEEISVSSLPNYSVNIRVSSSHAQRVQVTSLDVDTLTTSSILQSKMTSESESAKQVMRPSTFSRSEPGHSETVTAYAGDENKSKVILQAEYTSSIAGTSIIPDHSTKEFRAFSSDSTVLSKATNPVVQNVVMNNTHTKLQSSYGSVQTDPASFRPGGSSTINNIFTTSAYSPYTLISSTADHTQLSDDVIEEAVSIHSDIIASENLDSISFQNGGLNSDVSTNLESSSTFRDGIKVTATLGLPDNVPSLSVDSITPDPRQQVINRLAARNYPSYFKRDPASLEIKPTTTLSQKGFTSHPANNDETKTYDDMSKLSTLLLPNKDLYSNQNTLMFDVETTSDWDSLQNTDSTSTPVLPDTSFLTAGLNTGSDLVTKLHSSSEYNTERETIPTSPIHERQITQQLGYAMEVSPETLLALNNLTTDASQSPLTAYSVDMDQHPRDWSTNLLPSVSTKFNMDNLETATDTDHLFHNSNVEAMLTPGSDLFSENVDIVSTMAKPFGEDLSSITLQTIEESAYITSAITNSIPSELSESSDSPHDVLAYSENVVSTNSTNVIDTTSTVNVKTVKPATHSSSLDQQYSPTSLKEHFTLSSLTSGGTLQGREHTTIKGGYTTSEMLESKSFASTIASRHPADETSTMPSSKRPSPMSLSTKSSFAVSKESSETPGYITHMMSSENPSQRTSSEYITSVTPRSTIPAYVRLGTPTVDSPNYTKFKTQSSTTPSHITESAQSHTAPDVTTLNVPPDTSSTHTILRTSTVMMNSHTTIITPSTKRRSNYTDSTSKYMDSLNPTQMTVPDKGSSYSVGRTQTGTMQSTTTLNASSNSRPNDYTKTMQGTSTKYTTVNPPSTKTFNSTRLSREYPKLTTSSASPNQKLDVPSGKSLMQIILKVHQGEDINGRYFLRQLENGKHVIFKIIMKTIIKYILSAKFES